MGYCHCFPSCCLWLNALLLLFLFCFSLLFLFPSGLRSQVRFALCPAATYSSRAAVSATGRVHNKAIWLMTGRGGHCRKPPAGVERSVPRRLGPPGLLCFKVRVPLPGGKDWHLPRQRTQRGKWRGLMSWHAFFFGSVLNLYYDIKITEYLDTCQPLY